MLLIKNTTIHDGLGNLLTKTDILSENGVIKKIGRDLSATCEDTVDGHGLELFPGFIDPCNKWGAAGPESRDCDVNEHTDPITPELNVVYSFDHEGMTFQKAYKYGVSTMALMPSFGNVLGGQAAVYTTFGNHPYNMIIKEKVAMAASVSESVRNIYSKENKKPKTIMGMFSLMEEAFEKALRHTPDKDYDPKSEALIPVLKGEIPLFINAEDNKEMDSVELFLSKYPDIKYVFCGAFGIRKSRKSVAEGKVGVIIGDRVSSRDDKKIKYSHVNELLEQNAIIALGDCTMNGGSKENTLWNAILCVQNGIDPEIVLKMITTNPAKLLNIDNITGSIEEGKRADFSLWNVNPLVSYKARIEKMYINGINVLDKEVRHSCW